MSNGLNDPLLGGVSGESNNEVWHEDPWDDVRSVGDEALDEVRDGGSFLRGPLRQLFAVIATLILVVGAIGSWAVFQLNPTGGDGATVNFTVQDGDTISAVADRLETAGVISHPSLFRWYVSAKGGLDLTPGYFTLKKNESAGRIIAALSKPPAQTFISVTFPEGFTVVQMAARLAEKMVFMTAEDFIAAATGPNVKSELLPKGITTLEGVLFPDTYQVSGDDNEERVVGRMADMMLRVAKQKKLSESVRLVGLTPYQTLIVASLIEREAKIPEDRAKIARVIYNRLAKKMKLEIDASVKYNANPALSWTELKSIDTLYNTYIHAGLPPTPIANPGRASIEAALAPASNPSATDEACVGLPSGTKCEYLYYVLADATGRHVFATTYDQHLQNIEKARIAGVLP